MPRPTIWAALPGRRPSPTRWSLGWRPPGSQDDGVARQPSDRSTAAQAGGDRRPGLRRDDPAGRLVVVGARRRVLAGGARPLFGVQRPALEALAGCAVRSWRLYLAVLLPVLSRYGAAAPSVAGRPGPLGSR